MTGQKPGCGRVEQERDHLGCTVKPSLNWVKGPCQPANQPAILVTGMLLASGYETGVLQEHFLRSLQVRKGVIADSEKETAC